MRIAVVGGGIVGLASAYELAREGADVVVFEKGSLGNGSTPRSAGGIRTQFSTPVNVDLSLASLDVWESFEERFGTDISHRQAGYLFLARRPETAETFEENVAMQNARGADVDLLTPAEAREYCPTLHHEEFRAATYAARDGFADPHLALQGYASAAREAGAEIRTKTPVTGISLNGDGEVVGVETAAGSEAADFVVNAAGPWAHEIARMAGVDVPVSPRRRQVLVVDPEQPVPESVPLTIDLDAGAYFRPEREGAALVGGHYPDATGGDPAADPDAYSESFDLPWAAEALERASAVADYFGPDSEIRRGWAGLYAVTPDHHPIVEESVPGFVQAIGFSGHGFQHAPAVGMVVAELCLDGTASTVDVEALRSDRFEDGKLLVEENVA